MKSVTVKYFAQLRNTRGRDSETLETEAETAGALYDELSLQHDFGIQRPRLRVALNQEFASWDDALAEGDEIVFMPPVSGG